MNAGHTPCGARLVPEDAYDWAMQDGVLTSPTCAVERAVACVKSKFDRELAGEKATMETKYSKRLENLEKKMEMTGIRDLDRGSTVGDIKLAVNQIKAKLKGETVPTALATLFMAVCAFGGVTVQKANVNDLGDADVVTGVEYVFDGVTPGGATNIASAAVSNLVTKSFVEGLGIDAGHTDEEVKELAGGVVSNAVTKSYVEGLGIDAGHTDDEVKELAGGVVSNAVTKVFVEGLGIEADVPEYRVRTAVSNVVTKTFVDGLGLDAASLVGNAAYFDNIRTNADLQASEAFSNAVASVSMVSTAGLPHPVSEGGRAALVTTRTGDVLSTLVSTGGLQKVVMVDGAVHVPDLQSVWVGGEVVGDRIIGGETLYSALSGGTRGQGEIVGVTGDGNTLSVRYDMTAVVMGRGVRTNDTQWTISCPRQGISSYYDGTVVYPSSWVSPTGYLGFEWRGTMKNDSLWSSYLWYVGQEGKWYLHIGDDGYHRQMTFTAPGDFTDSSITFTGHPPSAPALTYEVILTRGQASRDKYTVGFASVPVRERIATEGYVDTAMVRYIATETSRLDPDLTVKTPSQQGSGDWHMMYWDGTAWTSLTNLPQVASKLLHPNGLWAQPDRWAFAGHSLTNLPSGVELYYNNGFWVCANGALFRYSGTLPWDTTAFVFSYLGEFYKLTRDYPWAASDRVVRSSELEGRLSVETNGVAVQIEAYFADGQVKWRLK